MALNLKKLNLAVLTLLIVFLASAGIGMGQTTDSPNQNQEGPTTGSTPGGVDYGPDSDSELWRKIRQGGQFNTVGGDVNSAILIQSDGQDWRMIRNSSLPKYMGIAILATLLLLSLFFSVRGRIKIGKGRSGRTIERFSLIERSGHWLLALSFIILALTGLNLIFGKTLLMPIIGKSAFASLTVFGKYIHNYVAFAFMLGIVMIVVMWVVHNVPSKTDLVWFLKGGGLIGSSHPPARKFNGGQKVLFWIIVLCGISISLSGWALMNPFTTNMFSGTFSFVNSIFGTSLPTDLSPVVEQQYQTLWHSIMAGFMICIVLAHIYIGSVGMEGAIDAMTTGEVDLNWAKDHHSLWVEEMSAESEEPKKNSTENETMQPAE